MRAGRGLRVDKEGDGTCKGDTDRAERDEVEYVDAAGLCEA
jgi:hypothetical protein